MAFPNITDIVTTTLANRSGIIADNVTNNNIILAKLNEGGRIKLFSGGRLIYQEIAFAKNANGGWYTGYDVLPVGAQDVISAAEFGIKQYAVPVVISGLEQLQNSGREQITDLMEERMGVAESTMANDISTGLYSDGLGSGGKQIVGLDAAVPATPTTGTYGGIDRSSAANAFWRPQITTAQTTLANVQSQMSAMWAKCSRGKDTPDMILQGNTFWGFWMASLQAVQRFTDPGAAKLGFASTRFMNADVFLDGGIGGAATATNAYFLNSKYIHFRPHKDRNMVPLAPNKRYAINQDSEVSILAFAGAMTMSGSQFQGRITGA